jgi:cysteine desulfurase/selenocysteine lyase
MMQFDVSLKKGQENPGNDSWALFKKDIPLLKSEISYLDNAATTQKPQIVIDTLKNFYEHDNANAHRGIYALSEITTAKLEHARNIFAQFVNAESSEIIFTKNTTEGINNIATSIERTLKKPLIEQNNMPNIVVTELEHHSNYVPWQQLAKRINAELRVVRYDPQQENLHDITQSVDENTIAVAFTAMSNVTGLMLDCKNIIAGIKKKNNHAIVIIDAAQAIAHQKIDVKSIGADFLCFSAHKVYGTTGVGIVYGRKEMLEHIEPFLYGGHMIKHVGIHESAWAEVPDKFEAGTLDAAGIIASAAGITYFQKIFEEAMQHEHALQQYALKTLSQLDGVKILGHNSRNYGPVISFIVERVHPHDLASICDRHRVCIRAGHHCAQPFMKAIGQMGTARMSLAWYNSEADVDKLVSAIKNAQSVIHG